MPPKTHLSLKNSLAHQHELSLRPIEVSQLLGVSTDTLRGWRRNGLLPASATTLGGHARYYVTDVQRVMDDQKNKKSERTAKV